MDISTPKIRKGQRELTPAQLASARLFAQERIQAILSTEPVNESSAEEHLRQAYRAAGLEPPTTIRWFDSPLGFCLARSLLNKEVGDSVRDSVRDSVWASVRASVGASVRDSVGASVRDSVWASVWDSVRASVGASVGASVRASVGASVGASVRDSVWASVRDSVGDSVWDSVWALWDADDCAFLWFFHTAFRENAFIHFAQMNEMIHGYFLGRNEAWLVRHATRLERDERGRLHSDNGMAIQYADGWGFYAWHGVRVPEPIILRPETLTKTDWLAESNLEVRRVMQERLSPDQFVALVGATAIHADECGTLVEVDLGDDPERVARYVHVHDSSTPREYYLRVPPDTERARQGIAWGFDIPEAEYCPVQEA
jgi:hypothetical protein